MKNKHAAGRPAPLGVSAAEALLALPRETKRLIMATADAVAIPTALWAALALKFDRLDPALDRTFAYFLIALVSALFFFSVFGLYRARSEEHTSELQSQSNLVCRLLLEKKNNRITALATPRTDTRSM